MDKLEMKSNNILNRKIDEIFKIFPECIVESYEENKIVRKIDFDVLKQLLSGVGVE